jgi:hypothetical protein
MQVVLVMISTIDVRGPSNLVATLPNTKHSCSLYGMAVASTSSEQQAAFYLFEKRLLCLGAYVVFCECMSASAAI